MNHFATRARRPISLLAPMAVAAAVLAMLAILPARAASQEVEGGSLTWGTRSSYVNYINSPIADGGFDVGGGASGSGPFVFPATGGSYDPVTGQGTISFGGTIHSYGHDYGQGYVVEMTWTSPRIVINGNSGTLVADLSFRPFVGANPNVDPPAIQTLAGASFATLNLSGLSLSGDVLSVSGAPATGVAAAMEAIGWDEFYSSEFPNIGLDPVTFAVNLAGVEEPTATATATQTQTATATATATASETTTSTPEADPPVVTLSKTVANPGGDTVVVTGEGFIPQLAMATRPPLMGKSGGVYVAFGCFADEWRPSEGAPSSARPTMPRDSAGLLWAVLEADRDIIGRAASVTLNPDGSFEATIDVLEGYEGALEDGNCGMYTYPGGGATQPLFETFTAISFEGDATPTATGSTTPGNTTPGATASATPEAPATGNGNSSSRSGTFAVAGIAAAVLLAAAGGVALRARRMGAGA